MEELEVGRMYIQNVMTCHTDLCKEEHELAVAQDTGAGQGEIIVDLQMDNEAARRAKLAEAEEKRQQNMLPVWHQQSTVSGVLVSTGDQPKDEEQVAEEEDTFEEVGTEEFDADRHECMSMKVRRFILKRRYSTDGIVLDYAKYYENLSMENPPEEEEQFGEEEEEEEEFETITNGNGKRVRSSSDNEDGR